jgi:hypothetical protein
MMTPLDMVRAITPGVPPSPISKPINIPLFESDPDKLKHELGPMEVPEFFRFGSDEELGIISYGRFLIFVTLLSIPSEQLSVAYHMSCGRNFKRHPELRADGLRYSNMNFILSRHNKTRDQGYQAIHHSRTSILRHLFGKDLEKTLTFEEFEKFHSDLKREVLKLEYYLLSDGRDSMSLVGFAKAVAALAPSEYRSEFEKRAEALRGTEVPPQWLIAREPLLGEDYDPPLETLAGKTASECFVSFEEYGAWKEVLKQLENMEQAVKMYQHKDGRFTPSGIMRAARAVAGVNLTKAQVWVIFQLFDKDDDEQLKHDDFVKLLIPHSVLQGKLQGPEGLGLHLLFGCCVQCAKDWYDGTMIVEDEGIED